jgi:8-oxo-dGTP diphosphatase
MSYKFCPLCAESLSANNNGLMECGSCKFIHYDNPIPTVSCLMPVGPNIDNYKSYKTLEDYYNNSSVILVKRAVAPFIGEWCLPCGHIDRGETPKEACVREVVEETGYKARLEKLLSACAPNFAEHAARINYLVIVYLARIVEHSNSKPFGNDNDVSAVGTFSKEYLPKVCFRSHRMIIDEWYKGTWGPLTGKDL